MHLLEVSQFSAMSLGGKRNNWQQRTKGRARKRQFSLRGKGNERGLPLLQQKESLEAKQERQHHQIHTTPVWPWQHLQISLLLCLSPPPLRSFSESWQEGGELRKWERRETQKCMWTHAAVTSFKLASFFFFPLLSLSTSRTGKEWLAPCLMFVGMGEFLLPISILGRELMRGEKREAKLINHSPSCALPQSCTHCRHNHHYFLEMQTCLLIQSFCLFFLSLTNSGNLPTWKPQLISPPHAFWSFFIPPPYQSSWERVECREVPMIQEYGQRLILVRTVVVSGAVWFSVPQ